WAMLENKNPPVQDGAVRPLAWGLLLLGAAVALVVRLVPHPFNLTPIGALGLYGGARLRSWQAYVLPLIVLAVSDLLLWAVLGYPPFNPYVYGSFVAYVLLGRFLMARTESPWRIGLGTVAGSVLFFLITNFGVWEGSQLYAQDLGGLVTCYAA